MKAVFAALVWCLLIFSARASDQSLISTKGCVVFKRSSEAVASFVEYRSYRRYRSHILVKDSKGAEVYVFQGQNPIFIPYPTGSSVISKDTSGSIERALKAYPELRLRLVAVQQAWAAAARKKVATTPRSGKSPKPPGKPPASPPQTPGGLELVRKDGTAYHVRKIMGAEPDGLKVMTETGVQKIAFDQLSIEMQKAFGYDPRNAKVSPEVAEAAEPDKARLIHQAKEDEQRKRDAADAQAAIQRRLQPAITRGARRIFGTVLKKTAAGVLIAPINLGKQREDLPGIGHYDAVSLLKGYPRANEWTEDDSVDVIAIPDGATEPYVDKIGLRRRAKVFGWIPNPLSEGKTEPSP